MQLVFENQTRYGSVEQLVDAVKLAVGHSYVVRTLDGAAVTVPRSISFARMDQETFDRFWDRVVDLVVTRLLPGVTREDLEREFAEVVGGGTPET